MHKYILHPYWPFFMSTLLMKSFRFANVWDFVHMLGCTITEACKYLNECYFGCEILCMWLLLPHLIISVQRTASWSSISLSLYWLRSISTRAISTRVNRRLCVMATSSCSGDEYCTTEPHRTEQHHKTAAVKRRLVHQLFSISQHQICGYWSIERRLKVYCAEYFN